MTDAVFLKKIQQNTYNKIVLERLPELDLPQAYLVAGCLFQTIWNLNAARPVTENINDYDVFYFENSDLSYEAEDDVIKAAHELFADLPIKVEVRNQARVHLWYEKHFGYAIEPLDSSLHGVDRYLVLGTCLGVKASDLRVYAPHGFTDCEQGILRPNPINDVPDLFQAKAKSYKERWPWLEIVS